MDNTSKSLEEQIKELQKENAALQSENLSLKMQISRLEKIIVIPLRNKSNQNESSLNLCDNIGEK
jgi:cell division protein FtsB